jgi:hypothetical protein
VPARARNHIPPATAAAQKLLPPEATDQEEDRHKTGSFGARTGGSWRSDVIVLNRRPDIRILSVTTRGGSGRGHSRAYDPAETSRTVSFSRACNEIFSLASVDPVAGDGRVLKRDRDLKLDGKLTGGFRTHVGRRGRNWRGRCSPTGRRSLLRV